MKKIILISLMLLASLCIGLVSAVPSCTVTDTFTNTNNCVTGASNVVTVSCPATTSLLSNITNVTLIYNNAVVSSNLTFNLTSYTFAFDSTSKSDTASGSIKASYNINGTTPVNSSAVSVEIDNTVPTVSLELLYEDLPYNTPQEATLTYSDGVDTSLTISQWLQTVSEGNTTTQSTTIASYEQDNFLIPETSEGYIAYGQAVDNCAKTTLVANSFNVLGEDDKSVIAEAAKKGTAEKKKSSNKFVIIGVVAALAAVAAIIGVSQSKSSKKRRR